jgi:hypothetical protein
VFPDISEFQGAVDWNALSAAYEARIIEAVALRASFGTERADAQFARNQRECRARGIPAIYYHFCYPTFNSPQAEASFFNGTLGPLQANEAMVGDFEDDRQILFPRGQVGVDWARSFLTALQSPQNATWWYTNPLMLSVIPFKEFYGVWPFWIADYSATPDSAFSQAIARQFTDCGSTPGVSGCCDQSRVLAGPLSRWLTSAAPSPPAIMEANMQIVSIGSQQHLIGVTSGGTLRHLYNDVNASSPVGWTENDPGVTGLAPYAPLDARVIGTQLHVLVADTDGHLVHAYQDIGKPDWHVESL